MERIEVLSLAPGLAEPANAAAVSASSVRANGTATIEFAHRHGLAHRGLWVFVVDAALSVLMLRRSPRVKTCPNTWSAVGEHLLPGEHERAGVYRAMVEELGLSPSWVNAHLSGMRNLTRHHVWEHHAHPDGRVDREWSALWGVWLSMPAFAVPLILDADARDHRWIDLKRLHHEASLARLGVRPGVEPRAMHFCDEAIRSCHALGARALRRWLTRSNYTSSSTHDVVAT